MRGWIYLITDGTYTKIGLSKNHPEKRIKQLQTGSAVPLELVYIFEVDDMHQVEGILHKQYASRHVHLEWFDLTRGDIREIMDMYEGTPYAGGFTLWEQLKLFFQALFFLIWGRWHG